MDEGGEDAFTNTFRDDGAAISFTFFDRNQQLLPMNFQEVLLLFSLPTSAVKY